MRVHKLGADIQVGDVIASGRDGFVVARLTRIDHRVPAVLADLGPRRIAEDVRGVGFMVYDRYAVVVLTVEPADVAR